MSAPLAPVAVLSAMPEELRPLLARFAGARRERGIAPACWSGRLGRTPVFAACSGAGVARAENAAAQLLERVRPGLLIGLGVAGGLSPGLVPGELLVAAAVRHPDGRWERADRHWSEQAGIAGAVRQGALLATAERILATAAERAAAYRALGMPAAAAVDLESAAWLRAAAAERVPAIVVRAVSESAEEDLPRYLARCRSGDGDLSRTRVVLHALAAPASLSALLQMRQRVLRCAASLAELVARLLS